MRTAPRKLRPFYPTALVLESISPVSSLAIAMPPTASPATGQAMTSTIRIDQPTKLTSMPSKLAASPILSQKAINRDGVGGFGPVVASTPPAATFTNSQAAPSVMVDAARYAQAITIATANVPLTRPSNGPTDNSGIDGGGGVGDPAATTAQPTNSPTAPTAASVPPMIVSPVESATSPSQATGIRPMSLAATSRTTPSAELSTDQGKAMPQQSVKSAGHHP